MSLWRHVTRGLRALAHRGAADRDLDDEVQHYLDLAAADLVARGLSADEARRAARLQLGNPTVAREQVRTYGWENVVEALVADVRYAGRRLRNSPGFTAVCTVTLALGVGATTAIFSAVNPILFEPLPYPRAERILAISDVGAGGSPLDVTFGTYRELAQRAHSFEALAVIKGWLPTATGTGEPERLTGQRVSAGYFRALGVRPALGRDFDASDDRPNGPRVVLLADGLWRRRFGGDSGIVGRQVRLDDDPYTVIGVMPSAFENVLAPAAELWAPVQYGASFAPDSREWGHHLRMIGRVRPAVSRSQATAELATIARKPLPEFPRVPWASLESGFIVTSLQDDVTHGVRPALLAVFGAVILLLAIACVNVTNLLLARGAQRRGEFAMRGALGAGRGRLIRQLLTESVVLALLGGALGMIVAMLGVRALIVLSPPTLPRLGAIRLDGVVFAFALGVTALVGVTVGLFPALQLGRGDLRAGLQHSSRRAAGDHRSARGALVVTEVALALMLLVSAGLLLRSLERVFAVQVGFDSSNLLTMQVQQSGRRFEADSLRYLFFEQALEAVRRTPGVEAVAFTSQLPLSGDLDVYGVRFENDHDPGDIGAALRYAVTPGYFAAMRIPLRQGRLLDARDAPGAPRVVVINESFARRRFPKGDALGQRLRFGPEEGGWYTIVGVVGDVKQASVGLIQSDAVYVSPLQWQWVDRLMSLVVRAACAHRPARGHPGRCDAAQLAPAVRRAIWSVDKDQPIVRVATMRELVARSAAERRFALVVFEAFALVALALAATGIYGVLASSVAERTREIGVRSALGASRRDILTLVVRQGMALTAAGVVVGLIGAAAASQAIVTLLFGVSRLDPLTYLSVVVMLLGVSGIACWLPAWRAARVDPAITLRAQ
ncbi:MAG: ABC transporter permease [Gemmatimonadota bacterium]|nr:ABC transporter permease [Gemmatimonadota bacterium]